VVDPSAGDVIGGNFEVPDRMAGAMEEGRAVGARYDAAVYCWVRYVANGCAFFVPSQQLLRPAFYPRSQSRFGTADKGFAV